MEEIIKGKTSSGFEFEINKDKLDDMEFIDLLAELKNGDYLQFSKIADFMLGKEQKAKLYEHIRKINGQARISLFAEEMKEILLFNSEVKN